MSCLLCFILSGPIGNKSGVNHCMCALARGTRSQWTDWSKRAWGSYWRDGGMRILPFRIGSWDTNHLDPADHGWWNCHEIVMSHKSPRAQSHSSCHFQDTENHHKTMLALHRGSLQSHGSVWPNLLTWWHCMNQIHRPTQTKQSNINNFQCSSVANNIQWKLGDFTNAYQKSSKINRNKCIILNPH